MRLYHYTSQQAAQDIHCSRRLKPGPSGNLHLTEDRYRSGVNAADRLGIMGKPVQCYCEVEGLTDIPLATRIYSIIGPDRKVLRLGGGSEYLIQETEVVFSHEPKWKVLRSP
jgi:hypothetical protein